MNNTFIKISATIIALLFVLTSSAQQDLILDKIIVRVGSELVLYSEVQELYQYGKQQQPDYDESFQCNVIEQLISSKLLLNQARLDSIEISDAEVEEEVGRRMEYVLSQMNGDEDFFIDYYGKTPLEYREEMKIPLREELTIQRIQGTLINEVQITPTEVIAYYNSIPKDSIPFLNSEVELAEIVYKPKVSEEEQTKALSQINEIKERIIAGEDFAELASIYSDDPGSGRQGGELGWTKRGSFVPEFEAEAYNLEVGELSEIVESQFGYHLIQLKERRGNSINTRHILVKPNINTSDLTKSINFLDTLKMQMIEDSLDFGLAVKRYSDEKEFSYNNAGRMRNPKTGDTFFETSELPHQVYFAIESLGVGDITDPISFDQRGETIYKLIKVMSKTRPHQASLSEDYARIQTFAKESKKNEYFNNWMEEKLDKTYILIDADFANCPNLQRYKIDLKE